MALEGGEPKFNKFIACVNSQPSAERLKSRFLKDFPFLSILVGDNLRAVKEADVVMLGCKPYMVEKVLSQPGMGEALKGKLSISFVVGTPQKSMLLSLGAGDGYGNVTPSLASQYHIVRGMMNLAASLGESMTVIEDVPLPGDFSEVTQWIFSQIGKTTLVAPELYDVGGVLAGTSAGFLSVAVDGMLDGAVSQGVKRAEARKIITQTLISLAKLLEAGDTPDSLREKFSSPRGTTIEGLMSLEEDRVRSAYCKAVVKATKRSQEMGK